MGRITRSLSSRSTKTMPTLSTALPLKQHSIRALAIVAAITLMFGAASPVWALSISQAYIISDWTSPTSATPAPFTVNGTAGFQLTLNSSGVATSATVLSGPLTIRRPTASIISRTPVPLMRTKFLPASLLPGSIAKSPSSTTPALSTSRRTPR